MRFWRKKWFQSNKKAQETRKSVFGGRVKSIAEVKGLSKKIKDMEKKEFEEYEKIFDADINQIYN